ncbi:MAG: hypothetical protein QE263_09395 [Vampirovibrionales bacterium]|nr:hypothetical protein [Vampirovibrionales bacterium]
MTGNIHGNQFGHHSAGKVNKTHKDSSAPAPHEAHQKKEESSVLPAFQENPDALRHHLAQSADIGFGQVASKRVGDFIAQLPDPEAFNKQFQEVMGAKANLNNPLTAMAYSDAYVNAHLGLPTAG